MSNANIVSINIDLGSTNARVTVNRADGTVTAINGKGPGGSFTRCIYYDGHTWYFDEDAVAMARETEKTAEAWKGFYGTDKLFLGGMFNAEQLETAFLKHIKKVAEEQLRVSLDGVSIFMSRSHSVSDVGAASQRKAAEMTGFKFGGFLSEQICSGYSFVKRHGLTGNSKPVGVLELDEGGWSFDTFAGAIAGGTLDARGTRSIPNVGGIEMSKRLMELALAKASKKAGGKKIDLSRYDPDTFVSLKHKIEAAKINLSRSESVIIGVPAAETEKKHPVSVTQAEFMDAIADLNKQKTEAIENALSDAKMTLNDIEFVIGSGGPLCFPPLQKLYSDFLGKPFEKGVDFSRAVIDGLSAFAFDELGKQGNRDIEKAGVFSVPTIKVIDRLPMLIGVIMHRDDSDDEFACPLFSKDTPVPSKNTIRARMHKIDQTDLSIDLVQAPRPYAPRSECIPIGHGELRDLPREQVMTDRFEFVGEAMSGGLVKTHVRDSISGRMTVVDASIIRHVAN